MPGKLDADKNKIGRTHSDKEKGRETEVSRPTGDTAKERQPLQQSTDRLASRGGKQTPKLLRLQMFAGSVRFINEAAPQGFRIRRSVIDHLAPVSAARHKSPTHRAWGRGGRCKQPLPEVNFR